MERLGERPASRELTRLNDLDLTAAIDEREEAVENWKQIYWEELIPLAQGVRKLGLHHNDAERSKDPYEFAGLSKGQDMLAMRRNRLMLKLAAKNREHPRIRQMLTAACSGTELESLRIALASLAEGADFAAGLDSLLGQYMDVACAGERLAGRFDVTVSLLLEMADAKTPLILPPAVDAAVVRLERRLYDAVGPCRQREAADVVTWDDRAGI